MSAAEDLKVTDAESFEYLRRSLQDMTGIALSNAKTDLVVGRLRKRMTNLGLDSLNAYVTLLKSLPRGHQEWQDFMNCLTTNKTDFFREEEHFHYLVKKVLPQWKAKNPRGPLKLWSVPCSTGEEPYTLAMVLNGAQKTATFDYSIAASDIDTAVLPIAKNGVYRKARLSEIPPQYHKDAFQFGTGEIKDWISIKPHLRQRVTFKHCNLVAPPYPWDGAFDVIFCRNVLIYFSAETVATVIRNLYEAAKPGSYLFVGHSESLHKQSAGWERVEPSIYYKKER